MPAAAARTLMLAAACLLPTSARAQEIPGAGAVARAGSGVVGADDASAFWLNPAGLARRGERRVELGARWAWHPARFTSDERFSVNPDAARPRQLAVPALAPSLAASVGLGERWVVGAALLVPTDEDWGWPQPDPDRFDSAMDQEERQRFPHRYAAGALELRQRGAVLAGSLRALPWLAVGLSTWLLRSDARESRTIWGGKGTIAQVPQLSPGFDLRFAARADGWSGGAGLGVLVAPPDMPIELGASLAYSSATTLSGRPSLRDSRGEAEGIGRLVRAQVAGDARAELELPARLVARAGTRFLGEAWSLELDGELARQDRRAVVWELTGVSLHHFMGDEAPLGRMPLYTPRRHAFALRAAGDWDAVPGFLTLTAGYAWESGGVGGITPALPARESHTLAGGASVRAAGFTLVLGLGWTLPAEVATDVVDTLVVAPLADGAPPAAFGRLRTQTLRLGVSVETAW